MAAVGEEGDDGEVVGQEEVHQPQKGGGEVFEGSPTSVTH